jgi:tRNA dimethylallyltransferase
VNLPPLTPVICGPTAGGKSDLAVALALRAREEWGTAGGIGAEIITADAFQVYRGMDIGTAKPSVEERRGVVHHLIDVVDPRGIERGTGFQPVRSAGEHGQDAHATRTFTVDDWLRLAREKITEIRGRGALPIVVGGTHLYIKALLDGLFDGPEPDEALRAELTAMDPAARRAELERVDPAAAARIHPNDVRRAVRALEVFRLTGTPISSHQKQWDQAASSEFQLIILDWESDALNRRINARVKQMMERGLLDEVRALHDSGALIPGSQPAEALGYKQLLAHLQNPAAISLDDAVEKIKIETRRFGKNQRTWLRRLRTTPGAMTIDIERAAQEDAVAQIARTLTATTPGIP